MSIVKVQTDNLEKLAESLAGLPRVLQRKVGRRALREAAKSVLPIVDQESKFPTSKTGFLKKQPKVRAIKRTRKYIGVRIAVQFREPFQNTSDSSKAFYALAVHYGHKIGPHGKPGRKSTKPNPYLERAADKGEDTAIRKVEEWTMRGIDEAIL